MVFVLIHCFLQPSEDVVSGGSNYKRETADTINSTFQFELIKNTNIRPVARLKQQEGSRLLTELQSEVTKSC